MIRTRDGVMVPAAVVIMGKMRGRVSATTMTALYPAMEAMAERASMLWARVVRGMSSTAKRGDAGLGDLLHGFGGGERAQESDEKLAAAHQREIGGAGFVVGAVAEDLNDDVALRENGGAVGENLRAFFLIRGVGISGGGAGAGFDGDFEAGFGQHGDDDGRQGDAALTGINFFGDSDDHERRSFREKVL